MSQNILVSIHETTYPNFYIKVMDVLKELSSELKGFMWMLKQSLCSADKVIRGCLYAPEFNINNIKVKFECTVDDYKFIVSKDISTLTMIENREKVIYDAMDSNLVPKDRDFPYHTTVSNNSIVVDGTFEIPGQVITFDLNGFSIKEE